MDVIIKKMNSIFSILLFYNKCGFYVTVKESGWI